MSLANEQDPIKRHKLAVEMVTSHWGSEDVLKVGLAHIDPKITQLTAEKEQWQTVVAQLHDKFRPIQPDLLAKFHFDRRPGSAPWSSEVEKFLFSMFDVPPSNYPRYEYPESRRKYAIEKRQPLLLPYLDHILAMVPDLQTLGITSANQ